MVPGMAHCDTSGPGADTFDAIGAITNWAEKGKRPDAMRAVSSDGSISRPLCKYPSEAVYRGGNPNVAESFACRVVK